MSQCVPTSGANGVKLFLKALPLSVFLLPGKMTGEIICTLFRLQYLSFWKCHIDNLPFSTADNVTPNIPGSP